MSPELLIFSRVCVFSWLCMCRKTAWVDQWQFAECEFDSFCLS